MGKTVLTIGELAELIKDMDPNGIVKIYDPDTTDDGITYTREIETVQKAWTTTAHDNNTSADILTIDLKP